MHVVTGGRSHQPQAIIVKATPARNRGRETQCQEGPKCNVRIHSRRTNQITDDACKKKKQQQAPAA